MILELVGVQKAKLGVGAWGAPRSKRVEARGAFYPCPPTPENAVEVIIALYSELFQYLLRPHNLTMNLHQKMGKHSMDSFFSMSTKKPVAQLKSVLK